MDLKPIYSDLFRAGLLLRTIAYVRFQVLCIVVIVYSPINVPRLPLVRCLTCTIGGIQVRDFVGLRSVPATVANAKNDANDKNKSGRSSRQYASRGDDSPTVLRVHRQELRPLVPGLMTPVVMKYFPYRLLAPLSVRSEVVMTGVMTKSVMGRHPFQSRPRRSGEKSPRQRYALRNRRLW